MILSMHIPRPGVIIHCHLVFKGLNDGGDISVLAMNKKLMEAQRESKYILLREVADVSIYKFVHIPWELYSCIMQCCLGIKLVLVYWNQFMTILKCHK